MKSPDQQNWESRVETLNTLYKRFMDSANQLDYYTAVRYTSPMADCFVYAISEMQNLLLREDGNDIINKALGKD